MLFEAIALPGYKNGEDLMRFRLVIKSIPEDSRSIVRPEFRMGVGQKQRSFL